MALITSNQIQPVPMNDKRILVKYIGGGQEPKEVIIGPGCTCNDLLTNLKLYGSDYSLSLDGSPTTAFRLNQPIYPKIEDGEILYISSNVDAGK